MGTPSQLPQCYRAVMCVGFRASLKEASVMPRAGSLSIDYTPDLCRNSIWARCVQFSAEIYCSFDLFLSFFLIFENFLIFFLIIIIIFYLFFVFFSIWDLNYHIWWQITVTVKCRGPDNQTKNALKEWIIVFFFW